MATSPEPNAAPPRGALAFLADIGYLAAGEFGARLIAFLSFAYLARTLDLASYAMLETVIAVLMFATVTIDGTAGSIGMRHFHAGDRTIIGRLPALRLVIALVAVPVLAIILSLVLEPEAALFGTIMLIALPIAAVAQPWVQQSIERMDRVATGKMVHSVIWAIFVLALVTGPEDLGWTAFGQIAAFLGLTLYFGWVQRLAGFPLRLEFSRLGALFKEIAPMMGGTLVWGVIYFLPPVFVAALAGPVATALFAAALRLVVAVQGLGQLYHLNLFATSSRLYHTDPEKAAALCGASFRILAWLLIGPAALAFLVGDHAMALVYGLPFEDGGLFLTLLALTIPIQFLAGHARYGLVLIGDTAGVLFAGAIGAVTALILLPLLTYLYGAMGASVAVAASALIVWIAYDARVRRGGLALPSPFAIWPMVLAAVLSLAIAILLPGPVLLSVLVFVILYATLAAFLDRNILSDFKRIAYARGGQQE